MLLAPQETRTFFVTTVTANRRRLCFGGERKASQIEYPRPYRYRMPLPLLRWERRALALRKSSIANQGFSPGHHYSKLHLCCSPRRKLELSSSPPSPQTDVAFASVGAQGAQIEYLRPYRHRMPLPLLRWERRALALRKSSIA